MMQEDENKLKDRIKTLRNIAITINEEAEEHKNRLDGSHSEFEKALLGIKKSVYKMRGMKGVRFSHTFYMFLFSIFFFVVLYFMFF